jgi:hypothetical protein
VSQVAWQWSTGDRETSLIDVLPGVSGPVMVTGDGAVGLDGASGEELWSYRLESGGLRSARTTPDGQEVLLTLPGSEPDTAVLLDAGTGRLIAEHEGDPGRNLARASALTSHVAVTDPAQEGGSVKAFSLLGGERVWTYEPPAPEASTGVTVENVLSAGETVVVIAAYNDGSFEDDSVDLHEQGMLAVGLEGETGEVLWEVDQEFADDSRGVAKHELSPGAEALFLEVGTGNQRHEFLIDPQTGEEIRGAVYQDRDRHPVGLLDDGYAEMAIDYDEGTVEYWRMSFEGEELAHLETSQRPAEGDIDRGLLLGEGVLRPDYLTDPDLDRGSMNVEFARWDSEGEPAVLNADMTRNEEWWIRSEGSATTLPDAPRLVAVPGAVVVTEENPGPWTVVGLT